eukprot:jgi/Mesvir1/13464/Mv16524-RA.1
MDVVLKPPPVKVKLNDDGKARASAERLSPEIMSPMSPGGHQLKSNLKEASEVVRAIDDAVNQPPPRSPRSAALLSRLLKGRTRDLGGGPSQGAPAMSPTDDAGREGSAADARTESCPLALPEFLLDIVMEPDGDGRDWQSLVQEVRQRPQSPRGSMQALHKLASTSCDLTPLDQSIEARKAVFESECSLLRSRLSELKGHIRALQT